MFETIIIAVFAFYLVGRFVEVGVLLPVVKFVAVAAVVICCGVLGFFHVIGAMDAANARLVAAIPTPPAGYELISTLPDAPVTPVVAVAQPARAGHVYGDGAISLWLTAHR